MLIPAECYCEVVSYCGSALVLAATQPSECLATSAIILCRHPHHAVFLHIADETARGCSQLIMEPLSFSVDFPGRAADGNSLVAYRDHEALAAPQPAAHLCDVNHVRL